MSDLIERQKAIDAVKDAIISAEQPYAEDALRKLPSAEPEHKAPTSYEEQISLDCSFCRQHECGDTLYESADWDGGIGFDYIRDIRFCPICGRELYSYEDEERQEHE